MRIKAIHTLEDGSVVIETDGEAIRVVRHNDKYSSAQRIAVIPDEGRHTVSVSDVPKRKRGDVGLVGGIAF